MNPSLPTRAKALFPYESDVSGDLTFEKEEIIQVLGREDENWWKGKIGARIGVFPKNFVEPLPEEPVAAPPPLPPRKPEESPVPPKPDLWRSNTVNLQAKGRNLMRSNTLAADQYSAPVLDRALRGNETYQRYGGEETSKKLAGFAHSNSDNIRRFNEEAGNPLLKRNATLNERNLNQARSFLDKVPALPGNGGGSPPPPLPPKNAFSGPERTFGSRDTHTPSQPPLPSSAQRLPLATPPPLPSNGRPGGSTLPSIQRLRQSKGISGESSESEDSSTPNPELATAPRPTPRARYEPPPPMRPGSSPTPEPEPVPRPSSRSAYPPPPGLRPTSATTPEPEPVPRPSSRSAYPPPPVLRPNSMSSSEPEPVPRPSSRSAYPPPPVLRPGSMSPPEPTPVPRPSTRSAYPPPPVLRPASTTASEPEPVPRPSSRSAYPPPPAQRPASVPSPEPAPVSRPSSRSVYDPPPVLRPNSTPTPEPTPAPRVSSRSVYEPPAGIKPPPASTARPAPGRSPAYDPYPAPTTTHKSTQEPSPTPSFASSVSSSRPTPKPASVNTQRSTPATTPKAPQGNPASPDRASPARSGTRSPSPTLDVSQGGSIMDRIKRLQNSGVRETEGEVNRSSTLRRYPLFKEEKPKPVVPEPQPEPAPEPEPQLEPESLANEPPAGEVTYAEVLYDFVGTEADDLSLTAGDKISVIEKFDVNWWLGEHNGTRGNFPSNHVREIKSPAKQAPRGANGLHSVAAEIQSKFRQERATSPPSKGGYAQDRTFEDPLQAAGCYSKSLVRLQRVAKRRDLIPAWGPDHQCLQNLRRLVVWNAPGSWNRNLPVESRRDTVEWRFRVHHFDDQAAGAYQQRSCPVIRAQEGGPDFEPCGKQRRHSGPWHPRSSDV
ncbi:hypothetical protein K493DRAFT_104015 [Basidiobolus meristosporus CBS 931.73]|uniref:SH3 domain-containing protein n=1 Tax=Basidiobolus meristosporus CBS 931.73 TaxID=1314790 RepID=A0A1Y1YQN2_9FUNG|nr:hypothetical protein K493DRAFT_104015 [Basidiobolus meristosporus CBS 931.73]|eukprot:ORY00333.1 hypothetical protein K493DRAFT_104015 [Basidiobolus meristosporus CBS 931.73]